MNDYWKKNDIDSDKLMVGGWNDNDDDIDDDREIYLGAPASLDRISIFHARLNSGDCGDGHSARKLQNSTLQNCFHKRPIGTTTAKYPLLSTTAIVEKSNSESEMKTTSAEFHFFEACKYERAFLCNQVSS